MTVLVLASLFTVIDIEVAKMAVSFVPSKI